MIAECNFYWQNMIYTGLFHSYWQNMQPIKSVLPFCSALRIQYTQQFCTNMYAVLH